MFVPSSPRVPISVRSSHPTALDDRNSPQRLPRINMSWENLATSVNANPIETTSQPLNEIGRVQRTLWMKEQLCQQLGTGLEIKVTDNRHRMLSVKRREKTVVIRCHHMFLSAPIAIVNAIARYALHSDPEAAKLLQRYVDQHDRWIRDPLPQDESKLRTRGQHHDLKQVLQRLNRQYFSNKVNVRICWGAKPHRSKKRNSIQLGSYVVEDKLIRIHWVLDAPDIPAFFVDWIVFHEMLHHIYPMPIVDGRRILHTREFRRAEMKFEHYAEAVLWERTHLRRLLTA